MRYHASGMGRLVRCPGSKSIQAAYQDTQRWEATEGQVAHEVAAGCLRSGADPISYLGQSLRNIYIDQEMVHHVSLYVEHCRSMGQGVIEGSWEISHGNDILTGTLDWRSVDTTTGTIYIRDLKYGFGWVEVFENYQLLSYAMLARDLSAGARINIGIVQPRANHPDGPIRTWEFAADDLRPYANSIRGAMERASMADPPTVSGSHCRYCRGLLRCHTAAVAAGYAMDAAGTAGHGPMTPDQFALEMEFVTRASEMLGQRLTAMEAEGISMVKSGAIIPGWEARQAMGAMAWTGTDPVASGKMLCVDLRQPVKAITPTQAIARKLLTDKMVKALTERSPGSHKLKRTDAGWARRILATPAPAQCSCGPDQGGQCSHCAELKYNL
jgi:hypothetical protein